MCTENFASLVGEVGPNDLVHKFRIGPTTSSPEERNSLWQANVWPAETWSEAVWFRETVEEYYACIVEAAHGVIRAICQALVAQDPDLAASLAPLTTSDALTQSSILTLLGYRTGSRHKGKNKSPLVASHTDVGVVTILLFDQGDCALLQRYDASGDWIDVELPKTIPQDPVFVVNIADCFSDLTQGKLPSTLHHVVAKPGRTPRNCCALFVGLDPTLELKIDGESLTFEEWRKRRIARSQLVLKSKR
jgi:isopenicillin N synthase-like dioxygenase